MIPSVVPLDPDGLHGNVAQLRRFADTSLCDRDEMFGHNEGFWVPSIQNQLFQRAFESIKNIGVAAVIDWHVLPQAQSQSYLGHTSPKVNTNDFCRLPAKKMDRRQSRK
jgi:hypothetical protein